MTRSTRSAPTHKESKKAFKQQAIEAGIDHKPEIFALWNQKVADMHRASDKARNPPLVSARNPRRMDGGRWNGSAFLCPHRVEDNGFDDNVRYSTDDSKWSDERNGSGEVEEERVPARVVCLLDMARPGKPKGIRKEFEVIEKLPGVIVLEDEDGTWAYGDFLLEDDWEEILIEGTTGRGVRPLVKSFADALRGG
ncbi:hypothetical protein F5887DRAFT_1081347 [Amanita rubescens]|nr:hypothetical protein F5887DRAFT_1081347 [Amanita rubescens]